MKRIRFDWNEEKNKENQIKHQVTFNEAQQAFLDPCRIVAEDIAHSTEENRFYCIGRIKRGILTVRFTYRGNTIRIYGAGFWRKGKKLYEDQNKIYE
jgi:uncharacterized protein